MMGFEVGNANLAPPPSHPVKELHAEEGAGGGGEGSSRNLTNCNHFGAFGVCPGRVGPFGAQRLSEAEGALLLTTI